MVDLIDNFEWLLEKSKIQSLKHPALNPKNECRKCTEKLIRIVKNCRMGKNWSFNHWFLKLIFNQNQFLKICFKSIKINLKFGKIGTALFHENWTEKPWSQVFNWIWWKKFEFKVHTYISEINQHIRTTLKCCVLVRIWIEEENMMSDFLKMVIFKNVCQFFENWVRNWKKLGGGITEAPMISWYIRRGVVQEEGLWESKVETELKTLHYCSILPLPRHSGIDSTYLRFALKITVWM